MKLLKADHYFDEISNYLTVVFFVEIEWSIKNWCMG